MRSGIVRQYLYKYKKKLFFLLDIGKTRNFCVVKNVNFFSIYINIDGQTEKTGEKKDKRFVQGEIREVQKYKV